MGKRVDGGPDGQEPEAKKSEPIPGDCAPGAGREPQAARRTRSYRVFVWGRGSKPAFTPETDYSRSVRVG